MDLAMPRLSDTMEEGTLGRWLKHEGEPIEKGEIIAEIQTDKANMELEAYQGGVLKQILVQEGETVPIGETIAIIGTGDESDAGRQTPARREKAGPAAMPEEPQEEPAAAEPETARTAAPSPNGVREAPATGPQGRIKASPLARRIAQELGVDLASVKGTGPNGRINRADVEKAAEAQPAAATVQAPAEQPAPAPQPAAAPKGETQPLTRMQSIVAQRMVQSKTQAPHIYVTVEIDMAKAMQLREDINALGDQKISFNDIVVKGCALALRSQPVVNSSFVDGGIRRNPQISVGVAVALEGGLIVPVVRNADQKLLRQIAAETRALAQKARENKLTAEDLSDGTFTVSNLGMYGVEEFGAIINQPESAILAVGAIVEKPVVEHGQIAVGHRMRVTLSCDHRVVYGAHAAEFLGELKRLLESPLNLGY